MTGRERIYAALTGGRVDRPPLLLGGPFRIHQTELPQDDLQWGWMRERRFLELREHIRPWVDCYSGFEPPLFNRYMMVSANRITTEIASEDHERRVIRGTIKLPGREFFYEDHHQRGFATDWHMVVPGDDPAVLEEMLAAPFEVDEAALRETLRRFDSLDAQLGDAGFPNLFLPSPAVAVSHGMHLENFLELCFTEPELVHSFCEEITRRLLLCIDALFRERKLGCSFIIGGSEQFTPPLMRPDSFDEFVVPYESQMVKKLKSYGVPMECHCHGRVRYALPRMIEMGYDATNPIEPPPQGDITYAEARAIAGSRLTLVGNFELVEIEYGEESHIRERVSELLSLGNERLMLSDAAGLRQRVTEQMDRNYRAWVDTYAEAFA